MTTTSGSRSDVLVVGGGPAGLACALLAARRGCGVTLLEAGDRLGGMSASIEVAGQRVDLGSHRLHPAMTPRVRALVDELLGTDLQERPRDGRLRLADRWVDFPLRTGQLLRTLPPALSAGIARDLATGPWRTEAGVVTRPDGAVTYADVVRARLGPTVLEVFHGPYARKLYGLDPSQVDGALARRRIALTGAGDVIRRLRRSATPEGRTFLYPRLGYGQIVERLAEAAVAAGVTIHTGTRPTGVVPGAHGVRVDRTPGGPLHAQRVLWTAPAAALASAADLPPPPFMRRGVVLVYLVVDAPRWTDADAHYVPDLDVPFVRISEPKRYRDGPDPAGRTVLCAEVPCEAEDERWTSPDSVLADEVVDGIRRLGLPDPPVVGHHVVRLPSVYPLVPIGWADEVRDALAALERLDGITLVGRQALEVSDNLHHVLEMAFTCAGCLAPDGTWDADRWAAGRRAFEDFVIED